MTLTIQSEAESSSAVNVHGVSHTYGSRKGNTADALRNIDLTITKGEFVALLGPSGSGKSTLLHLIAGLIEPTAGSITIDGARVAKAVQSKSIGLVSQNPALFPWRTVADNIRLPLEIAGIHERTKVERLMQTVNLSEFSRAYPYQLSGGMRSRVAIARALALQPTLLLMDEPFGQLDELTTLTLSSEIMRLWASSKLTALLVTHNVSQAVFIADRVIVLGASPGHIIADIAVLLPHPRTELTLSDARFINVTSHLRQFLKETGDRNDAP